MKFETFAIVALGLLLLSLLIVAVDASSQDEFPPFVLTGVVTDGDSVYNGLYNIKIISKSVYDTLHEESVWFEQAYNGNGRFRFDIPVSDISTCYEAYVIVEILSGTGSTTRQQLTLPELYMCSGQKEDVALITVDSEVVGEIKGVSPVFPYTRLDLQDATYILRIVSGNNLPSPPGG